MLELSASVDAAAMAELNRALSRAQRETGRSAKASVVWAARRVAMAGSARSRPGQRQRRLFQEPIGSRSRVTGQRKAFYVVRYSQKRPPQKVIVGTGARAADVRKRPNVARQLVIQRRGLARKVWKALGARVGYRASGGQSRTVSRNARVRKRLTNTDPMIELTNRLTYLEAAYPGITAEAVRAGARALNQQLDRRLRRAWGLGR